MKLPHLQWDRVGVLTALRYGMIKEDFEANKNLIHIHVPPELYNRYNKKVIKRRVSYDFFVGYDTIEALKAYLQTRRASGETITDESFLFVSERKEKGEIVPLDEDAINLYVKSSAVNAGLIPPLKKGSLYQQAHSPIHHHCLRKFYQTAMESAGIAKPWIDLMMGHKLGQLDRAYSKPGLF